MIKIFNRDFTGAAGIVSTILILATCLAIFVIASALVLNSNYVVSKDKLKIVFGFFVSKTEYTDITTIVLYEQEKKMTLILTKSRKINVCISDKDFNEFATALIENNKNIEFKYRKSESEK